jgi:hypothetical protein
MAIPFPEARRQDELAVHPLSNFSEDMFRWLREEWEIASPQMKVLIPVGVVVFAGFSFGLTWILSNWQGELVEDVAAPSERPAPARVPLEEALPESAAVPNLGPNERAILEQHFVAIGGVDRLASIRSILSSGEITFAGGEVRPIVVVKKQGARLRLSMRTPEGQLVMVVTPEDSWRCLWQAGRLVLLEDLDAAEAEDLRRSAYVVSELYLAMQNSWTVRYLGQQAFNYEMAHCFEVKVNDRNSIRFFIDPETFLDAGREEWLFDSEGTLTITRVVGSEHMDISGLKVPGKVEIFENNVYRQTFLAVDAEVNPGIFADAFERPVQPVESPATPVLIEAAPGL